VKGAVVDSSVIVKLVLKEESSAEAEATVLQLLEEGGTASTTEVALPEAANAVWKRARLMRKLGRADYRRAVGSLIRLFSRFRLVPTVEIAEAAAELALSEGITFYDSLYLTAAERLGVRLITADRRLHDAARGRVESTLIGRVKD
jgi:predicted nucleic acid-binding protein